MFRIWVGRKSHGTNGKRFPFGSNPGYFVLVLTISQDCILLKNNLKLLLGVSITIKHLVASIGRRVIDILFPAPVATMVLMALTILHNDRDRESIHFMNTFSNTSPSSYPTAEAE